MRLALPTDAADGTDEDEDDVAVGTLDRWPLPALRRQLLESRAALTRCEGRVVASTRAAAVAEEALTKLQRKHQALLLNLDVLRREVKLAEQEAAALVEPLEAEAH